MFQRTARVRFPHLKSFFWALQFAPLRLEVPTEPKCMWPSIYIYKWCMHEISMPRGFQYVGDFERLLEMSTGLPGSVDSRAVVVGVAGARIGISGRPSPPPHWSGFSSKMDLKGGTGGCGGLSAKDNNGLSGASSLFSTMSKGVSWISCTWLSLIRSGGLEVLGILGTPAQNWPLCWATWGAPGMRLGFLQRLQEENKHSIETMHNVNTSFQSAEVTVLSARVGWTACDVKLQPVLSLP